MQELGLKEYFAIGYYFVGEEKKIPLVLDAYAKNQLDLSDVNRVLELSSIKEFFDKYDYVNAWNDDYYRKYKELSRNAEKEVRLFFQSITENAIVPIYNVCKVIFWDEFWKYFYIYKVYDKISAEHFKEIADGLRIPPNELLKNKNLVEKFDTQITEMLKNPEYGARVTVLHLLSCTEKNVRKITTEEMREYLSNYQKRNNCSNVTIDNVRRNISSFFSWLEEEDYILKSPMKRIHKIKTKKIVKNTISDEEIEKLRDNCKEKRDLAMIDLLYSTGIRVGELVNLNIDDINFEGRECIVYGKGDKERRVYFDAKTKVHLKQYLETRFDHNEALFVTLDAPHERLKISGVEIRLRNIGRTLNLEKIHPHKFRRTMATRAIDKGMPIEQVQRLLGHSQIDTTMQYAMVNQNNVKTSHQKYIA